MASTRMINLDDLIQAASRGDPGAQERLTDAEEAYIREPHSVPVRD